MIKNKKGYGKHIGKYWQLYALMVMPICYFIVFKYAPMVGNVLAVRRYSPGKSILGVEWVGLRYFKMFMMDPSFHKALKNSLILSSLNLLINFPVPIILALLINEIRWPKWKKFIQTVSYMPRFISVVVVVSIMTAILSPSSGVVNHILTTYFGMDPIYFMNEPQYFRLIYILSDMWQYSGWTAIIYLAAITGISSEMYESAEIDGANRFKQILYITIPSIMPTITVMLILNVGRILTIGFEKVLLMYTPNNAATSDIIDTLVYRLGIVGGSYSYATAIGLFTGVIGFTLVVTSNFLSKKITGNGIY